VGFVHFNSFVTSIALGEVVDAESRNEGNHKHSHVPEANVKAFSWLAAGNAIGSMVGSTIGGYLSEPDGVPVLSGLELFRVKPYAAPGLFLMFYDDPRQSCCPAIHQGGGSFSINGGFDVDCRPILAAVLVSQTWYLIPRRPGSRELLCRRKAC
jgi:hypothetical protein